MTGNLVLTTLFQRPGHAESVVGAVATVVARMRTA